MAAIDRSLRDLSIGAILGSGKARNMEFDFDLFRVGSALPTSSGLTMDEGVVCVWFLYLPDPQKPSIDRSRRALSIGGIRLVWEVEEHT